MQEQKNKIYIHVITTTIQYMRMYINLYTYTYNN